MLEHLDVYMNTQLVGQLAQMKSGLKFSYSRTWLEHKNSIPISISMPVTTKTYSGTLVENYFDNLLPDSLDVRQLIAHRNGCKNTSFELLKTIGSDCVGALQFLPHDRKLPNPGTKIKIDRNRVASILKNLTTVPLGLDVHQEFRISIAGIQDKTSLHIQDRQIFLPLGPTPSTHILKPPIQAKAGYPDMSDSVENEHFCLKILGHFDIPVAETQIEHFEDQKALLIKRFDRHTTAKSKLIRLPQEDFCQALGHPGNSKYQSQGGPDIHVIMELLKHSLNAQSDRRLFFKTQILLWLLGAIDGHAKNFSVYLLPGGRFRLTPVYDVMSVYPYLNSPYIRRNQPKLAMSFGDSREYRLFKVASRHIVQSAKQCQLSRDSVEGILTEIKEGSSSLNDRLRANSEVNEEMATTILEEFNRRLLTI